MKWYINLFFAFFSLAFGHGALAHGGGLDKFGCHHNKNLGGYHCHRGKFAGQSFSSKFEVIKEQQSGQEQPTKAYMGKPRVIDGDTIWIDGTKIRLHGIDAPEANQKCSKKNGRKYRCGLASTQALRTLIGSKPVICKGITYDRYKRVIAVCYSGTVNLNAELVKKGWALAYRRYSKDYVAVEQEARNEARGMWAGEFRKPWEWRKR